MSRPADEARLVLTIVKALKTAYPDCWVFKVHGGPYQMAGVPDLLVSVEGLLFGFEVKHQRPGESVEHALSRATPVQRVQIAHLNRSGAVARVVTTAEEALATVAIGLEKRKECPHGARDL